MIQSRFGLANLYPRAADTPYMLRFSYRSKLAVAVTQGVLKSIGHSTWKNNQRFKITGFLRYGNDGFHQELEGDAQAIAIIVADILADKRHHRMEVERFEPTETRRFDRWHLEGFDRVMGRPQADQPNAQEHAIALMKPAARLRAGARAVQGRSNSLT